MTRVLAVSDEMEPSAYAGSLAYAGPEVVVACGDLPFDYLEYLVTTLNRPLVFVPGNHDPPISRRLAAGPSTRESRVGSGPAGCLNLDGRVLVVGGLRIAGLGGSHRYSGGPNQYSQGAMGVRSMWVEAKLPLARDGRRLDLLVTHTPPFGVGDDPDDPCHRGFKAFHRLLRTAQPRFHLHGHIHPFGRRMPDHKVGKTIVVNAVGHRIIEVPS